MKTHWVECHDRQRTDHAVWIRHELIQAVRIERPPTGETWQVYVDAVTGSARYGKLHVDRSAAIDAARGLLDSLELSQA